MKNRTERNSGPIDWVHFCCGAVLGGIEGARVAVGAFSHWWAIALAILAVAGALGLCCGFWQDAAWEVLSMLDWF